MLDVVWVMRLDVVPSPASRITLGSARRVIFSLILAGPCFLLPGYSRDVSLRKRVATPATMPAAVESDHYSLSYYFKVPTIGLLNMH